MNIEFVDNDLDRLETDIRFTAGLGREIVRGFRKACQFIRAAPDERDFYRLKGLHFEKLEGSTQRSIRINKKIRLILELDGVSPSKTVKIIRIDGGHYAK